MTLLNALPLLLSGSFLLLLFFSMRRLRTAAIEQQVRLTKRLQTLQCELGELRSTVQDMRSRLDDAERMAQTLVPPPQPRSSINISRRVEAIRLFRRGEQPAQVAAALSVPLEEAELLLKVQKILASDPPATAPAGERPGPSAAPSRSPARA